MNNSLDRMIAGAIDALRDVVIPGLKDEHARGQAFALIDLLVNLRPRIDWATAPLRRQVTLQIEAAGALAGLALPGCPPPPAHDTTALDGSGLLALRDALDHWLAEVVHWLGQQRARLEPSQIEAVESIVRKCMTGAVRAELALTSRPLFAEISRS